MTVEANSTRLERDSLGVVPVPAARLWGAQTERSRHHFAYGQRLPLSLIHAFGQLKAACAEVNAAMGKLDADLAAVIVAAADQVARALQLERLRKQLVLAWEKVPHYRAKFD
ncbi:MAG: hypothetical protein ACKN89_00250, partial [Cyanobium sp.]